MSTEQENESIVNVEPTDDLDTFAADFFGQKTEAPESGQDSEVEKTEQEETVDAQEEDTQTVEDDSLVNDGEEDEDSDEGNEKPKKMSRAEKRISELNAKFREEERQRKALEEQIARILANQEKTNEEPKPTNQSPTNEVSGPVEPKPDDTNEDGTDKYPLGEIDPAYIRALVRFEQETLRAEQEQLSAVERQRQEHEAARNAALQDWNVKLEQAKEEKYPDFNEKSEDLLEAIGHIDDAYGEYLSSAIMDMDNGVDVLYHLATNPDEARRIVELGPRKATIALGRLDASFGNVDEDTQPTVKKVSKAPTPPPRNKGSSPAKMVTPDTDDLEAFSNLLFKGN